MIMIIYAFFNYCGMENHLYAINNLVGSLQIISLLLFN